MADTPVVEKGCRGIEGDRDHLDAVNGVLALRDKAGEDRVVERAWIDGILGSHVAEVFRSECSAEVCCKDMIVW